MAREVNQASMGQSSGSVRRAASWMTISGLDHYQVELPPVQSIASDPAMDPVSTWTDTW
jgi:hypothetical protein